MKKIVLLYLYSFLILDTLMGFLLVFMGLKGAIILNPGQIVRGLILMLLFIVLVEDALKKLDSINSRILLAILYFSLFVSFIFLKKDPALLWTAELDNTVKLSFIFLLFYYIHKHKHYFMLHLDKIMKVNFWVLTANLFFSYFTGVGIATYGEGLASTKGFLYGGNAVSILSLIFFAYFFFKIQAESKAKYWCLLAIFDIYIVGTKAIFIVPGVILIYLITKARWTPLRIGIGVSVILPVLVAGIVVIQPLISQLFEYKYATVLNNTGIIASDNSSNASSLKEALLVYRRTAYATEQISHQFTDADGLIFGYGDSGQNKFWYNKTGSKRFAFAGMDFIDFLFEYGIIGSMLIYSIFFYAFYIVLKRWQFTALTVSFVFIFLYSFFGGYVLYGSTAGTMFAFLMALVYPTKAPVKSKLKKSLQGK